LFLFIADMTHVLGTHTASLGEKEAASYGSQTNETTGQSADTDAALSPDDSSSGDARVSSDGDVSSSCEKEGSAGQAFYLCANGTSPSSSEDLSASEDDKSSDNEGLASGAETLAESGGREAGWVRPLEYGLIAGVVVLGGASMATWLTKARARRSG
ncbi:MAG: hypothetical protein NTU41_03330, partial [Chloroflexi bacterium]|nr:hypothetical protein [Chloroflexota bacterium]